MAPRPLVRGMYLRAALGPALVLPCLSLPVHAAPALPAPPANPSTSATTSPPGPLLRTPPRSAAASPTPGQAAAEPPPTHSEPKYWTPFGSKTEEFPTNERDHEADAFDPRERHNIFNRPITHEWDPERIINTDRPDFTDVLPTVGKHVWQTESGVSFRHRIGEGFTLNRTSLPETTLRMGLTERFELRLKWDSFLYTQRTGTAAEGTPPGKTPYGSEFLVGFKWMAIPQAGWLPGHTFVGTLTTRVGTGGPAQTVIQPGVNWVYGWQMNKWLVVRGSTGVEFIITEPQRRLTPQMTFEPGSPTTIFDLHQSIVTYMQLVKRVGMYLEWFSFYDFGAERLRQHNGGAGFYIYLTPNIQIDLRGGGTLAGNVHEVFTGAGISFRGKYRYKKRD